MSNSLDEGQIDAPPPGEGAFKRILDSEKNEENNNTEQPSMIDGELFKQAVLIFSGMMALDASLRQVPGIMHMHNMWRDEDQFGNVRYMEAPPGMFNEDNNFMPLEFENQLFLADDVR